MSLNGMGINSSLTTTNIADGYSSNKSNASVSKISVSMSATNTPVSTSTYNSNVETEVMDLSTGNEEMDYSFLDAELIITEEDYDYIYSYNLTQLENELLIYEAALKGLSAEIAKYDEKLQSYFSLAQQATINKSYAMTAYAVMGKDFDTDFPKDLQKAVKEVSGFDTFEEFKEYYLQLKSDAATIGLLIYQVEQEKKMLEYTTYTYMHEYETYNSSDYKINDIDIEKCKSGLFNDVYNYEEYCTKTGQDISPLQYVEYVLSKNPNAKFDIEGYDEEELKLILQMSSYGVTTDNGALDIKKLFNFIYTNKKEEHAKEFIDGLENEFNKFKGELKAQEFLSTLAEENGKLTGEDVLNHIGVSGKGLLDGIQSWYYGIVYFGEGYTTAGVHGKTRVYNPDEYEAMYIMQALSSHDSKLESGTVTVDQNGNEISNSRVIDYTKDYTTGLAFNYELSQSIGNMAPSIAASVLVPMAGGTATLATVASTTLMGVSAAGNSYHSAMVSGSSVAQARIYGACSGLSEAGLQYFLGGIPGLSQADDAVTSITKLLKNSLNEGKEEFIQTYVDAFFRATVLKEDIDIVELTKEAIHSGTVGMASGGVFNTVSLANNLATIHQAQKILNTNSMVNSDLSYVDIVAKLQELGVDVIGRREVRNLNDLSPENAKYLIKEALKQDPKTVYKVIKELTKVKTETNNENTNQSTSLKEKQTASNTPIKEKAQEINIADIYTDVTTEKTEIQKKLDRYEELIQIKNSPEYQEYLRPQEEQVLNWEYYNLERELALLEQELSAYINPGYSSNQSTQSPNTNFSTHISFEEEVTEFNNNYSEIVNSKPNLPELQDATSVGEVGEGIVSNVDKNIDQLFTSKINGVKAAVSFLLSPLTTINKFRYKPVLNNAQLSQKMMTEGLYHFTSLETAQKILESGYVKSSGVVSSYGAKKSFFFAGIASLADISLNLDTFEAKRTAVKINVDVDDLASFNYRQFDDQAITHTGDYHFDSSKASLVYLGLFEENGDLVYKELTKEQYDNYTPNIKQGKLAKTINDCKSVMLGLSQQYDLFMKNFKKIKDQPQIAPLESELSTHINANTADVQFMSSNPGYNLQLDNQIAEANNMTAQGRFYQFRFDSFDDIPTEFWNKIEYPEGITIRIGDRVYSYADAKYSNGIAPINVEIPSYQTVNNQGNNQVQNQQYNAKIETIQNNITELKYQYRDALAEYNTLINVQNSREYQIYDSERRKGHALIYNEFFHDLANNIAAKEQILNDIEANIQQQEQLLAQYSSQQVTPQQGVNQMLDSAIQTMDNKEGHGAGIIRILRYYTSKDSSHLTKTDNIRRNISQLTDEQIVAYLQGIVSDYYNGSTQHSDTDIKRIQDTLGLSNYHHQTQKTVIGMDHVSTYKFYENFDYDVNYGVDQAAIEKLCIYTYNGQKYTYSEARDEVNEAIKNGLPLPAFKKYAYPEYDDLKNKLKEKGFTDSEASIIMSSINDAGACSYASVCNNIFSSFANNPKLFEQLFGYPMYKTNREGKTVLNSTELLLDLYIFANDTANGGTFINNNHINQNHLSNTIDVFGRHILDSENQVYMSTSAGRNDSVINAFLKSKNPSLTYESEVFFENMSKETFTPESFKTLLELLKQEMDSGKSANIDYFYNPTNNDTPIRMLSYDKSTYRDLSTTNWRERFGHSTTITGVTENGIVISSWGQKYFIPAEDLMNGGRFIINTSSITMY